MIVVVVHVLNRGKNLTRGLAGKVDSKSLGLLNFSFFTPLVDFDTTADAPQVTYDAMKSIGETTYSRTVK